MVARRKATPAKVAPKAALAKLKPGTRDPKTGKRTAPDVPHVHAAKEITNNLQEQLSQGEFVRVGPTHCVLENGQNSPVTQEVMDFMCYYIRCAVTPKKIIKQNPGLPNDGLFYAALAAHSPYSRQYLQAKSDMAHAMSDDIVDISDEFVGSDDQGRTDAGAVADKKLRASTRQWIVARMMPKLYGDRGAQKETDDGTIKVEGGLPDAE